MSFSIEDHKSYIRVLYNMLDEHAIVEDLGTKVEKSRCDEVRVKQELKEVTRLFEFWKKKEARWRKLAGTHGTLSYEDPVDFKFVELSHSSALEVATDRRERFESEMLDKEEELRDVLETLKSLEGRYLTAKRRFNVQREKAKQYGFVSAIPESQ